MRVYYPARPTGSDAERLTGQIPADEELAPYPVVIFVPGVNVPPDGLGWLAARLAAEGLAVVTYALIGHIGPGAVGVSPDIDPAAIAPDTYGSRLTSPSIGAVLAGLAELAGAGLLAGRLDLDKVALGGHSAGGTVALHNASPKLVPGLKAVFTYAAHTMVSGGFGYEPGSVLGVKNPGALLLMAGERDGVIAESRDRYGADSPSAAGTGRHDPVERTFTDGLIAGEGAAWFVELAGATHFGIVEPLDATTARSFLDPEPSVPPEQTRGAIGTLVSAVVCQSLLGRHTDEELVAVLASDAVSRWAALTPPAPPPNFP